MDFLTISASVATILGTLIIVFQIVYKKSEKVRNNRVQNKGDILDYYTEIILKTCDVIDLGGLPEGERKIAFQHFSLSELYIPLRFEMERVGESGEELNLEEFRGFSKLVEAGKARESAKQSVKTRLTIKDLFGNNPRNVILGDPGSGKSTLVKWISLALIQNRNNKTFHSKISDSNSIPDENWLPIIIRCRELENYEIPFSFESIIDASIKFRVIPDDKFNAVSELLNESLISGSALLIIDGLDEIRTSAKRTRFCKRLHEFATIYPEIPMLITSRIYGYREMKYKLSNSFLHSIISDLSREDKDEFAKKWCKSTELEENIDSATNELIQSIHSSQNIERITNNALQLTILALVKRKMKKLPRRREELYYECLKTLLYWRSEIDEPLEWREVIPQLEYISHYMCDTGKSQLDQEEIIALLREIRDQIPSRAISQREPEEFLSTLSNRTSIIIESGIVKKKGVEIPLYEFRHLTFQEYIAGLSLISGNYPNSQLNTPFAKRISHFINKQQPVEIKVRDWLWSKEYVIDGNWHEPIRLSIAASSRENAESALKLILTRIAQSNDKKYQRALIVLALFCLSDEPDIGLDLGKRIIKLIDSALENGDLYEPLNHITSLDKALFSLNQSEEWQAYLKDELIQLFLSNDFSDCDRFEELNNLGDAIGFLNTCNRLVNHLSWKVHISEIISNLNSEDEKAIVEGALTLAYECFYQFKKMDTKSIADEKLKRVWAIIINDKFSIGVRYSAARGMSRFSEILVENEIEFSIPESITDNLLDTIKRNKHCEFTRMLVMIHSSAFDVHKHLDFFYESAVIADTGKRKKIEPNLPIAPLNVIWVLQKVFRETNNHRLKRSCANTLCALGILTEDYIDPLFEIVEDTSVDNNKRKESLKYIGLIGGEKTIRRLSSKIGQLDPVLDGYYMLTLLGINNENAVQNLMPKLNHYEEKVREYTVIVIGVLGNQNLIPKVKSLLDDENRVVVRTAETALKRLEEKEGYH